MMGHKATGAMLLSIACCTLPLAAAAQERTIVIEPTGWFGVRLSDQAMLDEHGNAFFDSYPVVSHVDSASPASKAGVKPGDELLSFNGHDMRGGSVQLNKWLRAGAPFVLQIRRNDQRRTLRGVLAKRPPDWDQNLVVEVSGIETMVGQSGSVSKVGVGSRGQMPMTGMIRTRMPSPEPLPALLPRSLGYGAGVYPFAGAEFTELNEDLADVLGVRAEGVFVTRVAEASPARNAGLLGGDVVLRADSIKIDTPIDLVRAIRAANDGDRSLTLQIIRKRKPDTIILRW
jgi:S1-C subfamily serine protease